MLSHEEPNVVESLLQQAGEYAETRGTLLKLTTVDKASELISLAAVRIAVFLIASRTVLLLSIAGLVTGKGDAVKSGGLRILRSVLVSHTGDGSR